SLLEQPCARGSEGELDGIDRVLPFAADESILDLAELEARHHHFDVINIKLDKCGGLTEGLAMARRARELGKRVMVGNMCGTSLAAAPAFVLGQLCDVVDLDGPVFLVADRTPSVKYEDGDITCGDAVWGPRARPRPPAGPRTWQSPTTRRRSASRADWRACAGARCGRCFPTPACARCWSITGPRSCCSRRKRRPSSTAARPRWRTSPRQSAA